MHLIALLWSIIAPAHAEAPVGDVFLGWYLLDTARPEAAVEQAALALAEDPEDLSAHVLYIAALARGLREGPVVQRLYRDWRQQEPADELAAVGLALALVENHRDAGPWCEELQDALSPLPQEPQLRARALRVRKRARRWCPGDPEEGFDELRDLAVAVHDARSPVLRKDLFDGEISQADADLVGRYLADWPDASWIAGALYTEESAGPGLAAARKTVRRLVEEQAASDAPEMIYKAGQALQRMGETERAAELDTRRQALDPDGLGAVRHTSTSRVAWIPRRARAHWQLWRDLSRARDKRPAPVALVALARLEKELPSDEPALVAEHADAVADHLWWSLRRKASVERSLQAWQLDSTPDRANRFAYDAALAGVHLEEGLAAASQALEQGLSWDPRGDSWADGYEDWQEDAAADLRDLLDTRAWLLVQLERWEEARRDLRQAVLLGARPSAVVHLHLGLVEHHLGDPEAALLHLSRGLALGGGSEGRLRREARGVARQLLRSHRHSPLGLDAWVAARWPESPQETAVAPSSGTSSTEHWRVGQAFPDLQLYSPTGASSQLSDLPGLRVVDLWATWCGPCVQALPHLSEVAREYGPRGVRVLAVNVDDLAGTAWDFDDAPRRPHYELLWAGHDAMEQAKVSGIPATFVLDADGHIRAFFSGYGQGDTRLELALDSLLAEQP